MHLMRVRISTSQVALDALSVVPREQKLIPHACGVDVYTREIVSVRISVRVEYKRRESCRFSLKCVVHDEHVRI